MPELTRRTLLRTVAGLTGAIALGGTAACGTGDAVGPASAAVRAAERARRRTGGAVVSARLVPRPVSLDLGGEVVETWAYADTLPGPLLRVTAGDLIRVEVENQLPVETSVHWHGLALRNDMDGVPHLTQEPIAAGGRFDYEFTAPDPGTYFYHPHTGLQLDRGLYGVLLVDDPREPGEYDAEWVVVLDDWVDGTGRTPEDVLAELRRAGGDHMGGMGGMGGMDGMDVMGPGVSRGRTGDVEYPHHLVNGRTSTEPATLMGKPGERVRIRLVNAAADTAYRVALGGHRLTVTHSDGFPVVPATTDAVLLGMGERLDLLVTLGDGAFPLVAVAQGKRGHGRAVVRTSPLAEAPLLGVLPSELDGRSLGGADLIGADGSRLDRRRPDRGHRLVLSGSRSSYRWLINGRTHDDADPLPIEQGERVRLRFTNRSMMAHPMHLHGHTFGLVRGGARKDTVLVAPMASVDVDLDADNPGQWALHCHNAYHAEAGMMTTLSYRT